MRPFRHHRPRATTTTRLARSLLGLLVLVCALVLPRVEARAQGSASNTAQAPSHAGQWSLHGDVGGPDGDACGEADDAPELIACAGELEWTPGEPVLISLLRAFDLHMTEAACDELLLDVWSGQACEAGSRECGKMNSAVPPSPAPKLASSSVSARASLDSLGLGLPVCRRLSFAPDHAAPSSRDLPPPTPPPKLSLH